MANQLNLPGIEDPNEQTIQLPQWVESNRIVLGQPFVIWGKPRDKNDSRELEEITNNVFNVWENIRRALPWCSARFTTDPETGAPIIIAMPHHSGHEMIGSFVVQALAIVTNYLATGVSALNLPTSSFQLDSKQLSGHIPQANEAAWPS